MAGSVAILEQMPLPSGVDTLITRVGTMNGDMSCEEQFPVKEQGILELAQLFSRTNRIDELRNLITSVQPNLNTISKAKVSKLVCNLVDLFLDMKIDVSMKLELCKNCIQWAKEEKRVFLRQALEVRLMSFLYNVQMYVEALKLSDTLVKELGQIKDKDLLIEVHLSRSMIYHALENLPESKTALTSARITATTIYCPPKVQAALDLQSGILHAAIDSDFKTAFSYFYEAFEGFDSVTSPKALVALKYMLLSKIMMNSPKEVQSIIISKLASKYAGTEVEAMKAIAQAAVEHSLSKFEDSLSKYKSELLNDRVIKVHLETLYDSMFEQNLSRIIEPYSRVQVDYVSEKIGLKRSIVEEKLSQMILDKKLNGVLDQEVGVIIMLGDCEPSETNNMGMELIQVLGKLVDTLYQKANKLP